MWAQEQLLEAPGFPAGRAGLGVEVTTSVSQVEATARWTPGGAPGAQPGQGHLEQGSPSGGCGRAGTTPSPSAKGVGENFMVGGVLTTGLWEEMGTGQTPSSNRRDRLPSPAGQSHPKLQRKTAHFRSSRSSGLGKSVQ